MQTQADDKLVTTCEANDSVAINNNYSYYGLPKTFWIIYAKSLKVKEQVERQLFLQKILLLHLQDNFFSSLSYNVY